jgi:hypothetical protein
VHLVDHLEKFVLGVLADFFLDGQRVVEAVQVALDVFGHLSGQLFTGFSVLKNFCLELIDPHTCL